mmetsp:Transcript_14322/g.41199  ORF Transcript_14322/g.41199 Transcript_14322/m.41199 type:complete len:211 (+) Transcript_14322:157-789(+)
MTVATAAMRPGLAVCHLNNHDRITTSHGFIDGPAPMSSCSCIRGRWREGRGRRVNRFPASFPARRTRRRVPNRLDTMQLVVPEALRPRYPYRPFPVALVAERGRPVVAVGAIILAHLVIPPKRPTIQMAEGSRDIPRPRPTPAPMLGWMTPLSFRLRRRLRRLSLHPARAVILPCGVSCERLAFRGASRVQMQRMLVPAEGGNLPRTSAK